jgi:hypothetical protein
MGVSFDLMNLQIYRIASRMRRAGNPSGGWCKMPEIG